MMYVKEFLGHTNIPTTMAYAHVVNNDLAEIHANKHIVIIAQLFYRDKKEALAVGTFGAVRVLRYFHYIKQGQKCQ